MNLYEVIYHGSNGDANAQDTIYLVRAPDFRAAITEVTNNGQPWKYDGSGRGLAHVVYEIGIETTPLGDSHVPSLLRGPYFAFAHNFGWRMWQRKRGSDGVSYLEEWDEQLPKQA